jgi:hypothetical protein
MKIWNSMAATTWALTATSRAGTASAACVGSTCSLGGQLRGQVGLGLPTQDESQPGSGPANARRAARSVVATSIAC